MDSHIHLESIEGMGSTFHFKLIMPQSTAERSNPRTVNSGFHPLNATILLAEDNIFNRAIAKNFLESWQCKVLEAENGKEALEVLIEKEVDLVLLDLQMPVMDGYETIKAIRSYESGQINNLPVIALTAAAMGDKQGLSIRNG